MKGCPGSHAVHSPATDSDRNILTDNCTRGDNNEWLTPEGATHADAEIIIDMGCRKSVKGLQIKNINKKQGGTRSFTILLSDLPGGPWKSILNTELTEQERYGCAPMQTFNLELVYF